jgi:hypothetical protein
VIRAASGEPLNIGVSSPGFSEQQLQAVRSVVAAYALPGGGPGEADGVQEARVRIVSF